MRSCSFTNPLDETGPPMELIPLEAKRSHCGVSVLCYHDHSSPLSILQVLYSFEEGKGTSAWLPTLLSLRVPTQTEHCAELRSGPCAFDGASLNYRDRQVEPSRRRPARGFVDQTLPVAHYRGSLCNDSSQGCRWCFTSFVSPFCTRSF